LAKTRVFQLAKELGLQSQALITMLERLGAAGVTPASPVDEETAVAVRELLQEQIAKAQAEREAERVVGEVGKAEPVAAAGEPAVATPGEVKEEPKPGAPEEKREEKEPEPDPLLLPSDAAGRYKPAAGPDQDNGPFSLSFAGRQGAGIYGV